MNVRLRSALAYKQIANNDYKKVYDIPATAEAATFDGSPVDPKDTIQCIADAVKLGENFLAVYVPEILSEDATAHTLIVSDEHVIQLF